VSDQMWGDDHVDIRWSPRAHYDTGVQAIREGNFVAGLAHAALGLLLLQLERG
jgi:hypothetical protein